MIRVNFVSLNNLPLFQGLPKETLDALVVGARVKGFSKGSYVMHKGIGGNDLCFVLQGRLMVVDEAQDGRQTGFGFLAPGDFFGELSLIDGLPRSTSIISVGPSMVLSVSGSRVTQVMYENSVIVERLLKHLTAKIRSFTDYRALLSIPLIAQRVCALLVMIARPDAGGLICIETTPTQQHIAIMLNASRESVSRVLQVLFDNGTLERDNRRLIVRNYDQLVQYSKGLSSLERLAA